MKPYVPESQLRVGMMIHDRGWKEQILTVLGEEEPPQGYSRSFTIHSSASGIFRYDIPKGRVEGYPFVMNGEVICAPR